MALMRLFLAALVSTLLLAGCASSEDPAGNSPPDTAPDPVMTDTSGDSDAPTPDDEIISGVGTVQYVNLEGGFYGIVDEDSGARYNPDAIPDSLQIDGIRVTFRAQRRDVMTIQMWGTPVEILSIEQVD